MTDVVLINPAWFNLPPIYKKIDDIKGARTPLSILSLGSYLAENGYKVKLIDVNLYSMAGSDNYLYELDKLIHNNNIICVGLSVMTSQIPNAYLISQHLKELDSDIHITWGGVHPTLYPAQTSSDQRVDTVIYGPGEEPLLDIVQYIERGKRDFDEIKNVAYNGRVNQSRKPLDVNKIPFLDYDLLNTSFYIWHPSHFLFQKDISMLPMLSSRGCPYGCTFCINSVFRTKWRAQTTDRFLDELEFLVDKYKLDGVRFLDENFFISKKRTKEILKKFNERKIDIQWGTNIRADYFREDYVNAKLAKKLHNIGFTFASMGVESGSNRILEFIKKGITTTNIINSAKICHASGITPVYSWMTGIPTETKEEMMDTITLMKKVKGICPSSTHYSLNIYRPFPGGELYDICIKAGLNEPKSLEGWADPKNIDITLGSIPVENCVWIKDKDFVQFISNYTEQIIGNWGENERILDYLFCAPIKLRWWLQFFKYPNAEKYFATYAGCQLNRLKKALRL